VLAVVQHALNLSLSLRPLVLDLRSESGPSGKMGRKQFVIPLLEDALVGVA